MKVELPAVGFESQVRAAIVDYGVGNLFSVKHACEYVGMDGLIADSPQDVLSADVVIVPGVGAFGDAMDALNERGLTDVIKQVASDGRPLVGICLGMQLLMSESHEFGTHEGLGIIKGDVVRFEPAAVSGRTPKVPQVEWNRIGAPQTRQGWDGSPLAGLEYDEYMYFVHSYYARPADPHMVLSVSEYGGVGFCSSLVLENVFACQFHPERSGPKGLQIYRNIASSVRAGKTFEEGPVVR